jgi:DSF synthase
MVVEPGQGIEAAREYMVCNTRRHNGNRAIFKAGREVNPVPLAELDRIVQVWADACLHLSDRDLKVMQRLVAAQDRLNGVANRGMQAAE